MSWGRAAARLARSMSERAMMLIRTPPYLERILFRQAVANLTPGIDIIMSMRFG